MPVELKQELKRLISDEFAQRPSQSLEDKMAKEVACSVFGSLLDGTTKLDGEALSKCLMDHIHLSFEAEKIKLQAQLPKKQAAQIDRLYQQRMNQFDKRTERKVNHFVGITQKALQALEKELTFGIDQISSSLSEAKKHQCHPKDLKDALSKEADRIANELIEEEAQEKAKKGERRAKQASSRVKKSPKVKPKTQELQAVEVVTDVPMCMEPKETKCTSFVQQLYQPSTHCVNLPRVRRWRIEDPEQIRYFTDKSKKGETIMRYRLLSPAQILFQRAMHYLPGTERVWKSLTHREIYTFPTDRGAGMVARLSYNQKVKNGILYFGGNEKYDIFHRYFEEMTFTDRKNNVFLDSAIELMEEKLDLEQDFLQEWEGMEEFHVSMLENGALTFTYSDHHSVTIYPLNKELLDQQLNAETG